LLDALLGEEGFVRDLKSSLQLSDEQIDSLKQATKSDIARLRENNAELNEGDASDARARAADQISSILGDEKSRQLSTMAAEFWAKGGETPSNGDQKQDLKMLEGPNAVPTDTRIVVNIPAFRMDLFQNGSLIKTYKIGIGYPEFPLPQGLRKAQTLIFNPTWTPPDSPWVASMKNVAPGETVEAGSKLNPLGPIKIPIGMPSLIHGGKSVAKIGKFASHGCVGLTDPQVKDFANLLAQASNTQVSEKVMASYLQDKTRTRTVKLNQPVPVELRYETIVVEDGKLHIYKDVYAQDTNTEENLRSVLEAHGARFEDLTDEQRSQALNALNAMSAHPSRVVAPTTNSNTSNSNANESQAGKKKGKTAAEQKAAKNQKEVVIELSSLAQKGYPAPVNLDNGTGKPVSSMTARALPENTGSRKDMGGVKRD
jgi:lipoprotein-anchoring transpeptidase ErfK/SrfK